MQKAIIIKGEILTRDLSIEPAALKELLQEGWEVISVTANRSAPGATFLVILEKE